VSGVLLGAAAPVEVGRDDARSAARRELARPEYQADQPTLAERVARWVIDFFSDLLDRASAAAPGGYLGLLVLLALLVVAVVAFRLRTGPLGAARRGPEGLFAGAVRSSDDHRRGAEQHAEAGRWDEALRERLRALIRGLEERGLLDSRPGRTADEAAREAGGALPEHAEDLLRAARTFDDVWYGGRPADRDGYERLRTLDESVRRARVNSPA
jgi:hypothetical protein